MHELPDPRVRAHPAAHDPAATALYALAEASLHAATGQEADAPDAAIAAGIAGLIARSDGAALARLLDDAPTIAIYRHLWRALSREAGAARSTGDALGVTLFAIPLVIVARATNAGATLPAVLSDPGAAVAALREHGALGGNQAFALSAALAAAAAIDIVKLPSLLAACAPSTSTPLALPAAPIAVGAHEAAHLRFLVGSALAAPGVDLLREPGVGHWGRPLAQVLNAQLATPGLSVVALPRAAASLPAAVAQGRAAQREVSAQLFASNALRELRAMFGEPVAVVSAHRAADAPGGGELRLSLSPPSSPRDAEGFRCPLYPGERAGDVATMLLDLLRDCRVEDVRVIVGVHADRDPFSGGRLLFKPDTMPATPS